MGVESTTAIEIHDIVKHYVVTHDKTVKALDGLSFNVKQGEFFALLGPNGAGKTTLISILAGLSKPSSGYIKVFGFDTWQAAIQARKHIGVVPQELAFDPFLSVRETLFFQAGYFGLNRRTCSAWIDEVLERLHLSDKADSNMRSLSGGMKRRVMVAQALVHQPKVIVLDEPTAGVDVELRQLLWKFITELNQKGHTIVLTTHYLEEAESLCSRIAMLKGGKLVALQTTQQLLNRSHNDVLSFRVRAGQLPTEISAQAQYTPPRYSFKLNGAPAITSLLTRIHASGCEIEDIDISRPRLEDVFLNIMQQ